MNPVTCHERHIVVLFKDIPVDKQVRGESQSSGGTRRRSASCEAPNLYQQVGVAKICWGRDQGQRLNPNLQLKSLVLPMRFGVNSSRV